MEIPGQITADSQKITDYFGARSGRIEQQLDNLKLETVRRAALYLYNNICAVTGTAQTMCSWEGRLSSLVMADILRCLMEGMISIFAFARGPIEARAEMYLDFQAVLDFKFACYDLESPDSPFVNAADDRVEPRYRLAADTLRNVGATFLKGKKEGDEAALTAVLSRDPKTPSAFRDTWYPEKRCVILQDIGMGGLYRVLYKRLCSAVHSDAAASKILSGIRRDSIFTLVIWLWAAGMYSLLSALDIGSVPGEMKGLMHQFYDALKDGANKSS